MSTPVTTNALTLTTEEKKLWDALPVACKDGWETAEETLTFEDSDQKREIRMRNLHLTDPKMLELKKNAASLKTPEDVAKMAALLDLSTLPQEDMIELYFAMGPTVLSHIIRSALQDAKSPEAVPALFALTMIRHGLLLSQQPILPS